MPKTIYIHTHIKYSWNTLYSKYVRWSQKCHLSPHRALHTHTHSSADLAAARFACCCWLNTIVTNGIEYGHTRFSIENNPQIYVLYTQPFIYIRLLLHICVHENTTHMLDSTPSCTFMHHFLCWFSIGMVGLCFVLFCFVGSTQWSTSTEQKWSVWIYWRSREWTRMNVKRQKV